MCERSLLSYGPAWGWSGLLCRHDKSLSHRVLWERNPPRPVLFCDRSVEPLTGPFRVPCDYRGACAAGEYRGASTRVASAGLTAQASYPPSICARVWRATRSDQSPSRCASPPAGGLLGSARAPASSEPVIPPDAPPGERSPGDRVVLTNAGSGRPPWPRSSSSRLRLAVSSGLSAGSASPWTTIV